MLTATTLLPSLAFSIANVHQAFIAPVELIHDQDAPGYFLETTVESLNGIRTYFQTTYKLFKIDDEGVRELVWEDVARELYERSWVTPEGRVWIKTSSTYGPGSAAQLYVRDEDGRLETSLRFAREHHFVESTQKTRWEEATILQPRGDESVEILQVPDSDGRPYNYCLFRDEFGRVTTFSWHDANDNIDHGWRSAILADKACDVRQTKQIFSNFSLWESSGHVNGTWIVRDSGSANSEASTFSVFSAKPTRRPPDLMKITNGGRLLWFDLTDGMLYIYDRNLVELHRSDIVRLGRYRNADHARISLDFDSLKTSSMTGWTPLAEPRYRTMFKEFEEIEISDIQGPRLIWTIDARRGGLFPVHSDRLLTGLDARYKRERGHGRDRLVSEVAAESPSGRFLFRIRKYERTWPNKEPLSIWALTLISNETAPDGTVVPVELWSKPDYTEPFDPVVSDGGVTAWFKFYVTRDAFYGEPLDMAVCYVYRLSGKQMWGFDLKARGSYASVQETRKGVSSDKTTFVSTNNRGEVKVHGLTFPLFALEVLSIYHASGMIESHHIGYGQPGGTTVTGGTNQQFGHVGFFAERVIQLLRL